MPVTVTRLPDEPIILAEIIGHMKPEDAFKVYERTRELRQTMPPHIYRITDVTRTTTSVANIITIIKNATQVEASSTSDPTITVVFVGRSQWSQLFIDAMQEKQFGGMKIPIFDNREGALEYVRNLIQQENNTGNSTD